MIHIVVTAAKIITKKMERNQFPLEYIGYLQEKNNDLVDKLSSMKEMYEKKIFKKDMNKQYLLSLMKDALNVCTAFPKEMDVFFEELSLAMDTLKNILLRKSEMILLAEKISEALKPLANRLEPQNPSPEIDSKHKSRKKGSAVKVSPMINGHVILTEPRIYLNRVSQNAIPLSKKESQPLSPIAEVSSCASDSSTPHHYKQALSTPKKGKSSNKKRSSAKSISPKSPPTQKSFYYKDNEDMQQKAENDPLEGPSWLFNDVQCFVNFRRRRRNFTERLERRNKKGDEKRISVGRKRNSNVDDHDRCNERTISSIKDEYGHSRTSRKKSEGSGSDRSGISSSEYIEGTPPDSKNIKYKSKEQILRDIAIKQPMVKVEDCMTNKNLLKLIARSSCNMNPKSTSLEKRESNENAEDTNVGYECQTSEEQEIGVDKKQESIHSSDDFNKRYVGCEDYGTVGVSEPPNHVEESYSEVNNTVASVQENITNKNLNLVEQPDNDFGVRSNTSRKPSEDSDIWRTQVLKIKSESPNLMDCMLSSGRSEGNASDISTGSSTLSRESRQKRKAAPTNLTEPKLGTKLRRN